MNDTPNLALPYILPSQAQKHVTHNEAIRALDCLVQLAVESRSLSEPPASPSAGSRYLVAAAATGAWAGQSEKIAAFQDDAWAFYEPKEGWIAWVADDHELAIYAAGAWASFTAGGGSGSGSGSITELDNLAHAGINATADTTNRLALKSPASLFDNEGAGHQHKINKHASGDTASVLYQTNYVGHAEMGLAGDDDFHFKVSPDGATWYEALKIDRATGRADFPNTGVLAARNRIVNPMGEYMQTGLASAAADGAYTGFDQWYALTQSGAVTPSQLTDVESGTPFMMRLTQAQATAQRFGLAQPLEMLCVRDLRGKAVSLRARIRCSAATTIRWAVVEWTGTADAITRDVVNDWTNATFATGSFFIATATAIVGKGSVAVTANTLTDIVANALGTVSGTMNNLILFLWTDSAQAQNVTLDIGNVWFGGGGGVPAIFDPPHPGEDLRACQRYYCKSYRVGVAPGNPNDQIGNECIIAANSINGELKFVQFPVVMRSTPVVTQYSHATGAAGKLRDATANADVTGNVGGTGDRGYSIPSTGVSPVTGHLYLWHFTADARL